MNLRNYTEHIVLALSIILLVQIGMAFKVGVFSGQLLDTDCFTWLTRVTQLKEEGNWFDATLYRVDPPYGLEQHWTRPLDALLLGGAWTLTPFLGFEKGLHTWGVLISPVLQIASILCLLWAFTPVLTRRQLVFLVLGFLTQPAILGIFVIGRPDHHSLMLFLFVFTLGLALRMMMHPEMRKWAVTAGAVSALAFWVCIEAGVFIILPVIITTSVLWFLNEKNIGFALLHYSLSLLVFSITALLIQSGWSNYFDPQTDRISIIFILFFSLITLYSYLMHIYDFKQRTTYKMIFSGLMGVMVLIIMFAVYPQIFAGSEVDPLYREVRLENIGQSQLIFSDQWPEGLFRFLFWVGIILPTTVWFAYTVIFRKRWQWLGKSSSKTPAVLLSIYALVSLFVFAKYSIILRNIVYIEIIALFGYVVLMDLLVRKIEMRFDKSRLLYIARPLAIFILLTWFYYPSLVYNGDGNKEKYDLSIVQASQYIRLLNISENDVSNILAAPEIGPSILYHTNNNVLSIPNHKCKHGFRDWYNIMTAENDDAAKAVIAKRKVDYVLINKPLDKSYFGEVNQGTFYGRLASENHASWLESVPMPEDVPKDILLYKVVNIGGIRGLASMGGTQ